MGAVVIDASVASSWCFPDEQTEYTKAIFEAAFASVIDTVAPQLWAYEVRNSVLMGVRRGRITKSDSKQFLISLNELNVRLSEPASYNEVFFLAEQHGLTVYDAAYLNLSPAHKHPAHWDHSRSPDPPTHTHTGSSSVASLSTAAHTSQIQARVIGDTSADIGPF